MSEPTRRGQRNARILVVDDEVRYVRAIQINLEASGFRVLTAHDGQSAIDLVARQQPDLVILDVRMPGMDGFEVCSRVREFSMVPVIMLTALAEDADKVKGLDAGADDYVTKPFSAEELLARVRAVLRRADLAGQPNAVPGFQAGDLSVDYAQQRVFARGREVQLTSTEYRLLRELVRGAGRILTPGYLLEEVWGRGYEEDTHLVWQAIHRLRQKLELDPKHPQYIQTRTGIGYLFSAPTEGTD